MYLLIQSEVIRIIIFNSNLHPTMYLLIPVRGSTIAGSFLFTSHYVSINSLNTIITSDCFYNLHPTMYLLILSLSINIAIHSFKFTSHYVSINSSSIKSLRHGSFIFTSHYVSINSTQHHYHM